MAKLMKTAMPRFSRSKVATKAVLAQVATRDELRVDAAAVCLEITNSRIEILAKLRKVQWNTFFLIAALNIFTAVSFTVALHYLR